MKLATKFILALILGICGVLALRAWLGARSEILLFETARQRDQRILGQSLALAVENLQRDLGEGRVREFVEVINRRKVEIGIRLIHLDNSDVAPGGTALPAATVETLRRGEVMEWIDRTVGPDGAVFTYTPILSAGTISEAIELVGSLTQADVDWDAALWNAILKAFIFLVLYVVIVAALGLWFVGRPIRSLIEKARRIGAGDLSGPLVLRQHDELAELSVELNTMCDRLRQAQERVQAETEARIATIEQLRHADRLMTVGKISAGIAHEMGTPLNVAMARVKMVRSGSLPPASVDENCRIVVEQLERMTVTIRQLLEFARPRPPVKSPVDLAQVATKTLEFLEPVASRKGVRLILEDGGSAVPAQADPVQLQQVLTNLVMNAIQASPGGGIVSVTPGALPWPPVGLAVPARGRVFLRVRDSGCGIPEEDRPHLFEPFFTTKKMGEGTGLGLTVSEGIVREHGGWIDVESGIGKGSTFTVWLPGEEKP